MGVLVPTVRLMPGRSPQKGSFLHVSGRDVCGPLISCLMVTRGNLHPAQFAIDCYCNQTYVDRELVIICDRPDSDVGKLVKAIGHPTIRYIETDRASLGELRNISVAQARGTLICQWDDDDLYAQGRLELQAAALFQHNVAAVFLERWVIWWPRRRVLAVSGSRTWEGTMLARRDALPIYPARALAEDNITVARLCSVKPTLLIDHPTSYCYVVHGGNSYPQAHFEMMLGWASPMGAPDGYEAEREALAVHLPLTAYEEAMIMEAKA